MRMTVTRFTEATKFISFLEIKGQQRTQKISEKTSLLSQSRRVSQKLYENIFARQVWREALRTNLRDTCRVSGIILVGSSTAHRKTPFKPTR